jgi:hypothetical protein
VLLKLLLNEEGGATGKLGALLIAAGIGAKDCGIVAAKQGAADCIAFALSSLTGEGGAGRSNVIGEMEAHSGSPISPCEGDNFSHTTIKKDLKGKNTYETVFFFFFYLFSIFHFSIFLFI